MDCQIAEMFPLLSTAQYSSKEDGNSLSDAKRKAHFFLTVNLTNVDPKFNKIAIFVAYFDQYKSDSTIF